MRLCDHTRWGHSSSPHRACHNQRFPIRGFPPGAFLTMPHNRECEDSICNIIVSKLSRVNKISSIVKLWSIKTKQEKQWPALPILSQGGKLNLWQDLFYDGRGLVVEGGREHKSHICCSYSENIFVYHCHVAKATPATYSITLSRLWQAGSHCCLNAAMILVFFSGLFIPHGKGKRSLVAND